MRPLETLGETPSEVIVKTLIGKSITIPVAGDVSVAEIKAAVCEKRAFAHRTSDWSSTGKLWRITRR